MKFTSLLLGIFLGFFLAFTFVSAAECGKTPTDHCTISQDTTFTPGVYQVENLTFVVNSTTLDCNGARLIDKNLGRPLIQVGGTKDITIKNCYFTNYGYAVSNEQPISYPGTLPKPPVEHLTVRDNTFNNGNWVIRIIGSNFNNTVMTPSPAINHQIINNTVLSSYRGIFLQYTNNSNIQDNNFSYIDGDTAILLEGSSHNTIDNNYIGSNTLLNSGRIYIKNTGAISAKSNEIRQNTIQNAYRGIELGQGADDAVVELNQIFDTDVGVLVNSKNNRVQRNSFDLVLRLQDSISNVGVQLSSTSENTTVFMNFFDNTVDPAYDEGLNNKWNDAIRILGNNYTFGNFYDIFFKDTQCKGSMCCTDRNFDNICDDPYTFDVNKQDKYAMRSKSNPSGSPPPGVDPIADISINEVGAVYVIIKAVSYNNEPLTYAIKDSNGLLDPRFIPVLNKPNEFIWQTNLKSAGNYVFKAVATEPSNLNGGVNFNVFIGESDPNCKLYLPQVVSGCEVKEDVTFSPGTYLVPDGISVTADNVKLDCNGAVLDSNGAGVTGIAVTGRQNVQIKNCAVINNQNGMVIDLSNDISVLYSVFSLSIDNGAWIKNSQRIYLEKNTISQTQWGVRFDTVTDSKLADNLITQNQNGQLSLRSGSSNNNISENTISSSISARPIYILNSNCLNNVIYHNNFVDYTPTNKPTDGGANNQWNLNGEGNYYSPHPCIDNNWDGICDNPYRLISLGTIEDKYPFARIDGWKKLPYPQITVSSTTPKIGQPMTIQLVDPDMANKQYLFAMDLTTTPGFFLSDGRLIDLTGSGLFVASLLYGPQLGFVHTGTFDSQGVATVIWNVLPLPALHGLPVYFNFIPFNPAQGVPESVLATYKSKGVILQQ